jgi:hypothetical protein
VNVDTAQFAALSDRLATTEARLSEVVARTAAFEFFRALGRASRPEPRHARPHGHLRLVQGGRR